MPWRTSVRILNGTEVRRDARSRPFVIRSGSQARPLVFEQPDGFVGWLATPLTSFDRETMNRLATHFGSLLDEMTRAPESRVFAVPFLSAEERSDLVLKWNETASSYPRDRLVDDLVADQASRTPDAIAVVCGDRSLSYLLIVVHHIICDAWSIANLQREVSELLAAEAEGRAAELPRMPLQYADHARWQASFHTPALVEGQAPYWRALLAGYDSASVPALRLGGTSRPGSRVFDAELVSA